MIDGHRRYFIDNKVYDVNSGDVIVVPERVIHKVINQPINSPNDTYERYLLFPRREEIPSEFYPCLSNYYYPLSEEAGKRVLESMMEIEQETKKPHAYSKYLNRANLYRILGVLAKQPKCDTQNVGIGNQLVYDTCNYLRHHFAEPITLDTVSKQLFVNKSYLSATFRKFTGLTFLEYLTSMRILHASILLKETNYSIIQISEECGYQDSVYFSAVFKRVTGVTPTRYRRMIPSDSSE